MGTVYEEKIEVTGRSMAVLLSWNFLQRVELSHKMVGVRIEGLA